MPAGKDPHPLITASFYRLLEDAKVPDEFIKWCNASKVTDVINLATLSPSESEVDKYILAKCKPTVGDIDDPSIYGPIRVAYAMARRIHLTGQDVAPATKVEDKLAQTLDSSWLSVHGTPFLPHHKVGQNVMAKLVTMVSSEPVQFPMIPLDKITIESVMSGTTDSLAKVDGGTQVHIQQTDFLAPKDANMVFMKMRAFMYSVAYVSIRNPDFMNKTHADMACELLMPKILCGDESREFLAHCKRAYVATMGHWQTSISVFNLKFSECIRDPGWLPFWAYTSHPFAGHAKGDSTGKGKGKGKDSPRKSMEQILWNTLSRFDRNRGGGGKPQGKHTQGKGSGGTPWNRPYSGFHGGGKGKDKGGKNKGGKGKGGKGNK